MTRLTLASIALFCLSIQQISALKRQQETFPFFKDDREVGIAVFHNNSLFYVLCNNEEKTKCSVTKISNALDKPHKKTCEYTFNNHINLNDMDVLPINSKDYLISSKIYTVGVSIDECTFIDKPEDISSAEGSSMANGWYSMIYKKKHENDDEGFLVCPVGSYDSINDGFSPLFIGTHYSYKKHIFENKFLEEIPQSTELFIYKWGDNEVVSPRKLKDYPDVNKIVMISTAYGYATLLAFANDTSNNRISKFTLSGELKSEITIDMKNEEEPVIGKNLPDGGLILITKLRGESKDLVRKIDNNGKIVGAITMQSSPECNEISEGVACRRFYINEKGEYCTSSVYTLNDPTGIGKFEVVVTCIEDKEIKELGKDGKPLFAGKIDIIGFKAGLTIPGLFTKPELGLKLGSLNIF